MNSLVILAAMLVAIVSGQRRSLVPLVGTGDEYAASLGGVPVGLFGRSTDYLGGTEVHGVSLAGAKVGLSGRDSQIAPRRRVLPLRVPLPRRVLDPFFPYYPQYRPFPPYRPPFFPPYFPSASLAAARATADARTQTASAEALGYRRGPFPTYY